MTYKYLCTALLSATVFVSTSAIAAQDQLFLKNGDRLSGEITSFNQNTVTIETGFGTLNVDSNNIGGVASPRYEMSDLAPQTAAMNMDPSYDLTPMMDPSAPADMPVAPAPAAEEAAVTPATEDETGLWGAKWSGEINAGGEIQTGNSDNKSLTIDGETKANWDDIHRMTLGADYDWEEANDEDVTDEREVYGAYDYFFAENWFWNNRASWEQDSIENLDYRVIATSGLGYQFYDDDDLNLEVTFGPGYEREQYDGEDAEDNATANWSLDYEQAFYDDFFRAFHGHTLNSPWDDFSSYLFESETGVKIPLKNGITATGEVEFDWNNDPAIGEQEDDTTYSIKLGYEW